MPLPDDRVYWFATQSVPPGRDYDDDHRHLLETFGPWHAPIRGLLETTEPRDLIRHDIYDLDKLPPSFVTGNCLLLGDAAHAMTPDLGQGAGQAIEDAATLVLLLREVAAGRTDANHHNPVDLPGRPGSPDRQPIPHADQDGLHRVLSRYNDLRRPRTAALWRNSRLTGRVAQAANPVLATLRDTAMTCTPSPVMARSMARIHQWPQP